MDYAYTYDSLGRMTQLKGTDGSRFKYKYDIYSQVTAAEYRIGDATLNMRPKFSVTGLTTELKNLFGGSEQNVVYYDYDDFGRPTKAKLYDYAKDGYLNEQRYYDPVTCRFVNADSQLNSSSGLLGINVFAYCLNNPIRMIDPNGQKPGDLFPTKDMAARDFTNYINAKSIKENLEYASYMYTEKKWVHTPRFFGTANGLEVYYEIQEVTHYSYSEPQSGRKHNVNVPIAPKGYTQTGFIHTHGAYSKVGVNDDFSNQDITVANNLAMTLKSHITIYVSTPYGIVKSYSTETQRTTMVYPNENFPFDPNHPLRQIDKESYLFLNPSSS